MSARDIRTQWSALARKELRTRLRSSSAKSCPGPGRLVAMCMPRGISRSWAAAHSGSYIGLSYPFPSGGKGYDNPIYEPLWAAAQDLDIPLGMHIATNRPGPGQDFGLEDRNRVRNSFLANADHWVR